ncbi:PREDICTED: putative leucine-rich repeat-containing protein DDB_G0290503 [Nicrophorus vespilloides]|uniref:Leucine-rich repeat-containing protein DDB_G0290503 n=1 Tax=Nicrophorus vespilloides TaxID=110193 RepID=A0ABM1MKM8_NICVS|nr:PREDICTED: putative leucine-rich repeat-containing protein DDB_G0290503 [Nicrophorus vespilloides]
MKNRRTHSEHTLVDKCTKKKSSASLFERSTILLNSYSTIFKKTIYHLGDADTYFRKSLRNYDIDFIGFKKIQKLQTERKKGKLQLGQGDYSKHKLKTVGLKELEEEERFYSPKSTVESVYTMADEEEGVDPVTEPEAITEDEEEEEAAAEGVVEPPPPSEPPEAETEGEENAEDYLEETEQLVKEASRDIDAMEKDLDDTSILKEVEECEAQCMEIYKILNELKTRVHELLSKSDRTEQEDRELEMKQKLLNEKMALLEQKTRRIELLVGKSKKPDYDKMYDEDQLPKVVVCGLAENNMPKFIICDDKKRRSANKKSTCNPITGPTPECPASKPPCSIPCHPCALPPGMDSQRSSAYQVGNMMPMPPIVNVMPQFAQRLSESYDMQERLAHENADLECKRYKLQEDLLCKDQTVDCLQRQLTSLQSELRMIVRENGLLNSKLQEVQNSAPCIPKRPPCAPQPPCTPPTCTPRHPPCSGDKADNHRQQRMPCGKGKAPCPARTEDDETKKLEKQLNEMEAEVRAIQNELSTVRQERLHLEQHRRMLSPMTAPTQPTCPAACLPPCPRSPDNSQLKELREQYNTLQDDYKSKLLEVSGLRADVDKLKSSTHEAVEAKKALEARIKELDKALKDATYTEKGVGLKEQLVDMEQQMNVAKQRFRQAQDELEEMRALTEEQQSQLDDYRNKYLEAQQQVEEQRRQIDLMELENNRIGEQVNLEIQRVKNQFQEKLQELTPLPDILKATQLKLQEAQQMHMMAERNNEALLREIQSLRDKASIYAEQMEQSRSDQALGESEKEMLNSKNEELQTRVDELIEENDQIRKEMMDSQELADDAERRAQEKLHEIAQLTAEVDNVREESARLVARTKDRCETIRRSMQNQVTDLEKQLVQSRAQAKSAQRDRDDIRQKMQSQINNLNENFEDAQMRIRTLQGHVNFLKSSAAVYSSVEQLPSSRN